MDMSSTYVPPLPSSDLGLRLGSLARGRGMLVATVALAILALACAGGFAAATLVPRSHDVQRTTFLTP